MKNSKIVALVATAALLVIGAAFTSMAATYNWYQVDGIWHCKDKNGDDITQDWAKSGSDLYWLDENGEMATDLLVDDGENFYYVNSDGKAVKNDWVKVENTDDDGDEYYWYYFQASGKALKAKANNKPITVNGKKYLFDQDGKMLYGWISGGEMVDDSDDKAWQATDAYYAGGQDDGAVRTGVWEKIDVIDEEADFVDQQYWFYFQPSGLKFAADADKLAEKTINGKRYAFDEYGVMKAEWEATASPSAGTASISSYYWFQDAETGAKLKKGWFRVIPQASVNETDNDEETVHWYYAKGDGTLYKQAVKTINGKKYAFNDKGEMMAGLVYMIIGDGGVTSCVAPIDDETKVGNVTKIGGGYDYGSLYFFGDEETDGSMKYGTIKTEVDGDEYTFTFKTTGSDKGSAIKGFKNNAYYVNGAKVKADADYKYQSFAGSYDSANKEVNLTSSVADTAITDGHVLISSPGAIVKKGTKKDADGTKIYVNDYTIVSHE